MSTTSNDTLDRALKQLTYGFYLLATRADGDDLKTRDKDWVAPLPFRKTATLTKPSRKARLFR
jgi:hypothetical protein